MVPPQQQTQLSPVSNVALPEGYIDILGIAMDNTTTQPEKVEQVAQPTAKEVDLQKQNEELMRQLEQSRQELQEARKLSEGLQTLKEERDLDELLKQSGVEFGSISPDDAKKLIMPVFKTVRQQHDSSTAEMQKRMDAQQEAIESRFRALDEQKQFAKLERTKAAILQAHPDLEQLQKTPAYQQAMMSSIGGKSKILVGQLVAAEYKQGNAEYVIEVLNRIKAGTQPNLSDIASVSPSSAGVAAEKSADENSDILTDQQIAELKYKVQSKQITRDEFRAIMAKHREARR